MSDLVKQKQIEQANQFNVPLPETCEVLNWQDKTLFCWVETSKGEIKIWQQSIFDYMLSKASDYGKDILDVPKKLYSAPTLQEILKAIFAYNKHLVIELQPNYINLGLDKININEGKQSITFSWENENLAECAAQVYLELITYT